MTKLKKILLIKKVKKVKKKKKKLNINSFLNSVLILVLVSCSNVSIFQGLDKPDTRDISELTGEKLLSVLEKNRESKTFYETLTPLQKEKILSSLDSIISENYKDVDFSAKAELVTKASLFAIDILINTDLLTYAVIYDLVDPVLIVITKQSATPDSIFSSYTKPLQKAIEVDKTSAEKVISKCFTNLYKITYYYNIASKFAKTGSYTGGDLQKYLVSGIVGGIISGTMEAVNNSNEDINTIINAVSQAFIIAEGEDIETILTSLINEIPAQLGDMGINIGMAYKNELLNNASTLTEIAKNAGYENFAKSAVLTLERWGS